jgi:hypothetical protein
MILPSMMPITPVPTQQSAVAITAATASVHVFGVPMPKEMMMVVEGSPFTVPTNKIFVVTGTGVQRYGALHVWILEVRFNGQLVLTPSIDPNVSGVVQIPVGLTATAGTVVSTSESGGTDPLTVAVVFGYLADA